MFGLFKPSPAQLFAACKAGRLEEVKKLISKGVYVNIRYKDSPNKTPLMFAINDGQTEIVKLLLDHGANPNATHDALINAAKKGYTDIVKLLLDNGADVNVKSALDIAIQAGDINIVELLLEKLAETKNSYDTTSLEYAMNKGHIEIAKLLLENHPIITLKLTAGRQIEELIKLLSTKGADVNARDDKGRTALTKAAEIGYLEIVKLLISKGADVNARDDNGETPLMKAVQSIPFRHYTARENIVDLLISNGADISMRDNRKKSAKDYADKLWESKHQQILCNSDEGIDISEETTELAVIESIIKKLEN